MYDTVIFDYGNTLCKMGSLASALEKVDDGKQAHQIGSLIEQYIQRLYIPSQDLQPDWRSIWQAAFATYGRPFDEELGLKHIKQYVEDGSLYPYTVPLLEALHCQGTKLVLLSNVTGCSDIFQQDFDSKGLSKYFDRVIWSSEIGYRKPSKHAYQLALISIGSELSKILMVGDNEIADIQGAKSVGLSTMLISDHHTTSKFSDYVVIRGNLIEELLRLTRQD
jgi:HAD superfamily hydrolase (TIGR01549 family)